MPEENGGRIIMYIEKLWAYREHRCMVVAQIMGHRCGYIEIPQGHPLYGVGYDEDEMPYFDVHGGLTFSGTFQNLDGWWIGYDCAHDGDGQDPAITKNGYIRPYMQDGTIRTLDYCIIECQKLVDQLIKWTEIKAEETGKLAIERS